MTPKKQLMARLAVTPRFECVKHPNPKGLGPRQFLKVEKGEFVFLRPVGPCETTKSSFTPTDADIVMTEGGFTIDGGRIEYRFLPDQTADTRGDQ